MGDGERNEMSTTRVAVSVRRVVAVVGVVLLMAWPTTGGAGADATVTITGPGLLEHLEALQSIGDDNGGNRAFNEPGYDASVDYVAGRLEAAGYTVERQTIVGANEPVLSGPSSFARVLPTPRAYVDGVDYDQPEPGSPVDVSGTVVVVPDACDPNGYAVLTPGDVALVQISNACDVGVQLVFASIASPGGLLMISEGGPGTPPEHIDPGDIPFAYEMATLTMSADAGAELWTLAQFDTVTVSITTGWTSGEVETTNVVAELPGASSDEVVMVGAHLDSVPAGPGINDNGSGVAAVLELAEELAAAGVTPRRTIRFGFWAAEEIGLVGSTRYVEGLSADEQSRIVAYLNLDMIGSPNWIRAVYDPIEAAIPENVPAGSQALTDLFEAHFAELGLPTVPIWTNGRSDDASFSQAGIPVGGLFSGIDDKTPEQAALFGGTAGVPADPCYHQACDRLGNVDLAIAAELAQSFADVTLELAGVDEPIPTSITAPAGAVTVTPVFTG